MKSVLISDTRQFYSVHVSENAMNFAEAKDYCLSLGLRLIRPQSSSETSNFVRIVSEDFGGVDFWMGISDEMEKGNWTDIHTGRPMMYFRNWDDGEAVKNETDNHHAVFKTSNDGVWSAANGKIANGTRAGCIRG